MNEFGWGAGMRFTEADWIAMVIFGREKANPRQMTPIVINGCPLSRASVALLYADIGWLMTLWDKNQ